LWTFHECTTCTHSILRNCQKHLGDILWCAWSQDYQKQVVSLKKVFHHQNARNGRLVYAHQHGQGTCESNMFHWGKD